MEQIANVSLVVGVGASAGGVRAIQDLLKKIPAGTRMSFVVVMHRAQTSVGPDAAFLGPELSLPVRELHAGDALEAGVIYLAPSRHAALLEDGRFNLQAAFAVGQRLSVIDATFHSLGKALGARAVGVVLSGDGSDGTAGLERLTNAGGFAIAQAPDSCEHPSMPSRAIASGSVDQVLRPEDIAAELVNYEEYLERVLDSDGVSSLREEIASRLIQICEVLFKHTHHDFKHYKTTTLVRRIQRRLQVLQLGSVEDYLRLLEEAPGEAETLMSELLINVTSFFRDPEAFAALNSEVLVPGLQAVPKGERYRIWVAGCSTGEEVYSIAMLVREQLAAMGQPPEVQILATDVDEDALAIARKGVYGPGIERTVSRERLDRFFVKRNGRYHVEKSLRELCLFSSHNLIGDPPFSQLDLISCRNVLIYLGTHLQKKLIPVFHYALRPNGYLFLGNSESLSTHRELFRTASGKHRIAQRKPTAIRSVGSFATLSMSPPVNRSPAREPEADLHMIGQRILLDEFSPRYAIVNDDAQIVSVSAGISEFLEPSEGNFQNSVVKLVHAQLRMALRSVFAEAKKHKRRVEHDSATLRTAEKTRRIGIVVQPMPNLGEESGLYMVVFKDLGTLPSLAGDGLSDPGMSALNAALIDQLEKELAVTREDLDKSVQDLEASNEELKSSNEELLSMNEELQSANEELEASKEEIQLANDALQRSNSDLENLLGSTEIATLFLDNDMRIRGFTPALTAIYPVQAGDVGRRITDFAAPAPRGPALPTAETLVASGGEEHEFLLPNGKLYLRRSLPYRTHHGERDGVVVTFVDITELSRTRNELKENTAQLRLALDAGRLGTFFWNVVSGEVRWSDQTYRHFGFEEARPTVTVELFYEVVRAEDRAHVRAAVERALGSGEPFVVEFRATGRDGKERWILETGSVFKDGAGQISHVLGAVQDISERKLAQISFERNVDVSPAILWITEVDGSCSYLSRQWYEFTGQTEAEALGWGWLKAVHPDDFEKAGLLFQEASEQKKSFYVEYRLRTRDGSYRWAIDTANPRFDEQGRYLGLAGTVFDIHDRVVAEDYRREIESRFVIMADSAPVLIWISGADRKRFWFNRGWRDFTGESEEKSAGDGWLQFVHPADRERYLALYNESFDAKEEFRIEYRLRHHSGQYRWISARGVPRFDADGALEGYVGACLDINEVKLAQEIVRINQERYRTLTEVLPQLVWTCTPDGACSYLSSQWVDYTGIPEAAQLGYGWLDRVVHPDDRERVYAHWRGAVEELHPYDTEFRILRHDGSYRWFKTRGTPVRNPQGQITEWVGTCTDVSDEKRYQAQLRDAISARDEFLSIASHELKTPVTSLRLQMQILARQLKLGDRRAADPAHLNKVAELSIRQTRQLAKLIDDMLDVSRIETGRLELSLVTSDVSALVREALEGFLPHFRDAEVEIKQDLNPALFARVDAYRIEQVFINLFTNALKYGQGRPVTVSSRRAGPNVEISVADAGPGIAPANLERIFGRFERAISANEVSGLGLGLYICRRIADSHGGSIRVESELGQGAIFTLSLPAADAPGGT